MKDNNLAIAILGSVAVGTVLGILFAPARGCETRRVIGEKSTTIKNNLLNSSEKIVDVISQIISDLNYESQQFIGNTKGINKDTKTNLNNLKDINKATIFE
ncbi:YtxH domain-containing protein [Flavobacterium sandaracinum]|uniref:YtxH domain-containing protein n=1 Tax=Flavobacterium sandaracinum TaxID=2541733 RepID=A0A4R5CS59_9FLAO|nr:YtxH domain-containing protein [Flavobacterium sandaracinum]TDE01701.1 YtxH domain-containing protein [Flavobacterium sandaracinum]